MNLVIGYGNKLRGDDAVGRLLAEAIEEWGLAGVRALSVHQLTPELALDIADSERVVFLDAVAAGAETAEETVLGEPHGVSFLRLWPTAAATAVGSMTHHVEPLGLLALSGTLYGASPEAYLLGLPAVEFEVGPGADGMAMLSETARVGMERALALLRSFLAQEAD